MLLFGLVLVAAVVALAAGIVIENSEPVTLTAFGHNVPGLTTDGQVFLVGCVLAVILMAGMAMASTGMRRIVRVRRALRDLRETHEASITTLELEKRQLQRELALTRRKVGAAQVPAHATPAPNSPFFDSKDS